MDAVTDHVARALARLPENMRKPRIQALLTSWVNRIQEAENAQAELRAGRHPAVAEGVQLDGLGQIVKWPRRGMNDTNYRPMLQVAARVNKNATWADEVIEIILIVEPNLVITYLDSPPAEYIFRFENLPDNGTPHEVLEEIIRRTRPVGVRVHFEYLDEEPAITWTLKRHADADDTDTSPVRWTDDPKTHGHGRRAWSNAP